MLYEIKPLLLILTGAIVIISQIPPAVPFAALAIGLGAFIMGMRFIYRSQKRRNF